MRLITRHIAVLLFFIIAPLPALFFGINGPWYGQEPLHLSAPPPFPNKLRSNFFRLIDPWFSERVGFRYPLIAIASYWHIFIWKWPMDPLVFFGREGWIFYSGHVDSEFGSAPGVMMYDLRGRLRFRSEEMQRANHQMRNIRDQFAACGKSIFFIIAPNKQSIYREFAIEDRTVFPATRLDDFLERIDPDLRTMIIDLRPHLRASKSIQATPLYYKTDTHWNKLGAFYAYQEIVKILERAKEISRPELASLEYFNVVVTPFQGGDIATRKLFSPWRFPDEVVSLRPKSAVPEITVTEIDDEHSVYKNSHGKGHIVLVGDSFLPQLADYLGRHFEQLDVYQSSEVDGAFMAQHKADVMLFERVERYLPMSLLSEPKHLASVCGG